MSYIARLEKATNLLCLGLDPVPERLPPGLDSGEFLATLLVEAEARGLLPPTLKPNLAYFEQLGWRGWRMLERLVERWSANCLIILDAKRGDIGRSSQSYARAMFLALKGDAVTLHPWMGPDSVQPFLEYLPERGSYLLLRTSNPGGDLLQAAAWRELFRSVDSWDPSGGMGFVVGATRPSELEWVLSHNHHGRPLLIPGVGTQGGSPEEMTALLSRDRWSRRYRVNVSSAILYAHEAEGGSFPESNLAALKVYLDVFALPQD